MGGCGLFGGASDQITTIDASQRTTNTTDSYNVTSSWSQGLSDIGSTKVTFSPESPLTALQPVLIIGAAVAALAILSPRGRGGGG
jgi:hypothetical protein